MKAVFLDAKTLGDDVNLSPIESVTGGLEKYERTAPDEVLERIRGFDTVLVNKVVLSREHFEACPELETIAVVATDAPLLPHQLNRLAKRAALGIGRLGSYAAHGSGEIVVSFSTANRVPRKPRKKVYRLRILGDAFVNPLYEATVDATEEAILNSLFQAETMIGAQDRVATELPIELVKELLQAEGRIQ